ncbi:MAG TPA: hypothetical protein VKI62_05840, partial [Bacteroidota bacterium]|nr:hypothetical protein [Bacteroidota bacterium]
MAEFEEVNQELDRQEKHDEVEPSTARIAEIDKKLQALQEKTPEDLQVGEPLLVEGEEEPPVKDKESSPDK